MEDFALEKPLFAFSGSGIFGGQLRRSDDQAKGKVFDPIRGHGSSK